MYNSEFAPEMNKLEQITYSDYLQLPQLLNLQKFQSPNNEHDELLFIIIHQVYELWFKQIIYEFVQIKKDLQTDLDHKVLSGLKRIRMILKVLVLQTDILETMNPLSFLAFRNHLGRASGFQSVQFREIEFILGFKNDKFLKSGFFKGQELRRLKDAYKQESFWENALSFFQRKISGEYKGYSQFTELNNYHYILIYIYKNHSILTEIAELILDVDEGIQEWRYRHIKMVERTIGKNTIGTGGSSGVEYLKKSLFKSFCPELLEIRNYL